MLLNAFGHDSRKKRPFFPKYSEFGSSSEYNEKTEDNLGC